MHFLDLGYNAELNSFKGLPDPETELCVHYYMTKLYDIHKKKGILQLS